MKEKLRKVCPHIGKPCIKGKCSKWIQIEVMMQSKIHSAANEMVVVRQCQDDQVVGLLTTLSGALGGFLRIQTATEEQKLRSALGLGINLPRGT